jgi:hypothetical protein
MAGWAGWSGLDNTLELSPAGFATAGFRGRKRRECGSPGSGKLDSHRPNHYRPMLNRAFRRRRDALRVSGVAFLWTGRNGAATRSDIFF